MHLEPVAWWPLPAGSTIARIERQNWACGQTLETKGGTHIDVDFWARLQAARLAREQRVALHPTNEGSRRSRNVDHLSSQGSKAGFQS